MLVRHFEFSRSLHKCLVCAALESYLKNSKTYVFEKSIYGIIQNWSCLTVSPILLLDTVTFWLLKKPAWEATLSSGIFLPRHFISWLAVKNTHSLVPDFMLNLIWNANRIYNLYITQINPKLQWRFFISKLRYVKICLFFQFLCVGNWAFTLTKLKSESWKIGTTLSPWLRWASHIQPEIGSLFLTSVYTKSFSLQAYNQRVQPSSKIIDEWLTNLNFEISNRSF